MEVVNFLNLREIGNPIVNYGSRKKQASRPNLDNVVSRLACRERCVYMSESLDENEVDRSVPPFACKFRRDKHKDLLAVANEEGVVALIDTSKRFKTVKAFNAHHNAIYDICWLPDKNHLITGSGDHAACLWDMNTLEMVSSFKRHRESIKSVDVCHYNNAIFATGARDGSICVWDTREVCSGCGNSRDKPSIQIKNAHCRKNNSVAKGKKSVMLNNNLSSVSAVAFQDDINLASAGAADGVLKIWDLRKSYMCKPTYVPAARYQMKCFDDKSNGHGCTSLVFDSNYKKLYACSTSNKIFMFDCHTYSETEVLYEGLRCDTYYIKLALSVDDQYLACGSSDNKAYVWKTSQPGYPSFEFPGHSSEVTTVAWGSEDVTKFVTCGDDHRIMIWETINNETDEPDFDIIFTAEKYKVSSSSENKSPTFSNDNSPSLSSTNDSPTVFHSKQQSSLSLKSEDNSSTFMDGYLVKLASNFSRNNSSNVSDSNHPSSSSAISQNNSTKTADNNNPSSSSIKSQNNSPMVFRTPKMKSIKSFFRPLTSPGDDSPLDLTVIQNSSRESNSRTSPVQVLSPSKLVNRNVNTSPESSVHLIKSQGKENQFGESSTGQAKRKSSNESTPEIRKNTKRGRHNSSNNSAKKAKNNEDIRSYFNSSLSPKE